jgi:M6 family metalloprotease-like protein
MERRYGTRRSETRRMACAVIGAGVLLGAAGVRTATAQSELRGRLHLVWDAEPAPDNPDGVRAFLVENDGRATRLLLDLRPGRPPEYLSWDRRPVEAQVDLLPPVGIEGPRARLRGIRPLAAAGADLAAAPEDVARLDFITVLCRFPDDPPEPLAPDRLARVVGPEYPGMRQYYAELSRNPDIMAGNQVTAVWYELPQPRSYYIQESTTAFGALATDCTTAADPDVDFASYYGINLQFGGALSTRSTAPYDVLSFGGSWTLTLDGQARAWGMTWMSVGHAENYVVYAHEMGHALGWPHSSGRYGQAYDSNWDVMSRGYLRNEAPWGWLTVHTIGPYKSARGWIPAARRWEPAPGAVESGIIVRTALPPDDGYLIAVVPRGPDLFLTAEVRQLAGHDTPLPGQAVLLHEVDFGRAYVVDADQNGNPNDAGAAWTTGETFTDSLIGLSLRVDSAVPNGFAVTVTRGWQLDVAVTGEGTIRSGAGGIDCPGTCSRLFATRGTAVTLTAEPADGRVFQGWTGACTGGGACSITMEGARTVGARFEARRVLAQSAVLDRLFSQPTTLTAADLLYLDLLGNGNGRFDIGDVLAWLIDTKVLSVTASLADVLQLPRGGRVR